jgi:dTDP-4-amino-4,6-dideoxygalactose transaminase
MHMTPAVHTETLNARAEQIAPTIPFLDLKAQFAGIRGGVMAAIAGVMESQSFIMGPDVKLLEEELAAMLGAKHAIACASGTDALILSLMAVGIGPGDEVITTPFSFIATAGSIAHVGAKPVFVDIDPVSYNIDASLIPNVITERTRAIMPVHLFGNPANMEPILKISRERGFLVIEDAAQAIGARWKGHAAGTLGDFGCFSFFPSKNLGGAGDGGLITTNRDDMAERLRMLRVHGSKKKYHHDILGTNSRLDTLQAAILRVKARHLDEWTRGREKHANRYRQVFHELQLESAVTPPPIPEAEIRHVYNQFTIRCKFRDELKDFLKGKGVPTEVYYPLCLHLQPAFGYLGHTPGDCPAAEKASEEVLSLPVSAEMTEEQLHWITQSIAELYADRPVGENQPHSDSL